MRERERESGEEGKGGCIIKSVGDGKKSVAFGQRKHGGEEEEDWRKIGGRLEEGRIMRRWKM